MVAIIKTGTSIRAAFNYNENKVSLGVASCIGEANYPIPVSDLKQTDKLNLLLKQLQLNENVTRNSVHISLNFDRSENTFSNEKLVTIAHHYMARIGFGKQPYLVYRHEDAGHPHIHIVSIKVRSDGTRIDMNNIGRNESETARKAIEKEFCLVPAESHKKDHQINFNVISASKVVYGKLATKSEIQKVLAVTLNEYKYTSIPELNAVLNQYNVKVDRGTEDSFIYKNKGLQYRVLDVDGKAIGVPIKASLFYQNPTLSNLEVRFAKNKIDRTKYKAILKNELDKILGHSNAKGSLMQLKEQLQNKGIHAAFRTNDSGLLYGITYVDHRTKCVFNGSDLGKDYSAKAIQELFTNTALVPHKKSSQKVTTGNEKENNATAKKSSFDPMQYLRNTPSSKNILELLIQSEQVLNDVPNQLKKKKKNKRKSQPHN